MFKAGDYRSIYRGSRTCLFLAGLLFAAACADGDEPGPADEPVAEVALESGLTVSFYEPSPGAIAIMQTAPVGVRPVRDDQLTAVELYSSLVPGQPVPAALVAAQARQDAAHADRPPASKPGSQQNVGASTTQSFIDNNTIDDQWFYDTYCTGNANIVHCRLNQTDPLSTGYSDVDEGYYMTCADVGNVTLKVWVNGDLELSRDILEGHCAGYHWTSGLSNDSTRGEVSNVSPYGNDRYHYSARYWL